MKHLHRLRRALRLMNRTRRSGVGGFLLTGLAGCAAGERQAYEDFQPKAAMQARLANPAFAKCVDDASAPYRLDTQTIQGCYDAEAERLDARLDRAVERARAGSGGQAMAADHEAWRRESRERCDKANPSHQGWGWTFELQSCYLDETKRRILWLESSPGR